MAKKQQSISIPPVVPYLTVKGAAAAVQFYKKAFGAVERRREMADDGKRLLHSSLAINNGMVMLSDDFPEFAKIGGTSTPEKLGGTATTIHLEMEDADKAWNKAIKAGAKILMPLADMFWGARYGKLRDPFGHVWSIAGPIKKKDVKKQGVKAVKKQKRERR